MSLWVCPEHGLYGGQVFCPKCSGGGEYVTLGPAQGIEAATAVEAAQTDSVHESPVGKADAPSNSANNSANVSGLSHTGVDRAK